ncbi:MAG: hypothetical protein ACFFDV_05030 [Candidatus Thorarchaeota archaeon]
MEKNEIIIEGKIVSSQLGGFGKTEIVYGYIGIEVSHNQSVMVKIDSYTWYETLDIGKHVIIHAAKLGSTNILVARKVSVKQGTDSSSPTDGLAVSS